VCVVAALYVCVVGLFVCGCFVWVWELFVRDGLHVYVDTSCVCGCCALLMCGCFVCVWCALCICGRCMCVMYCMCV